MAPSEEVAILSPADELLLASRVVARGLTALYVTRDAGRVADPEVFAAEHFCMVALRAATSWGDPAASPSLDELRELSTRVLISLLHATSQPRESFVTLAAIALLYGTIHGGTRTLTDQVAGQTSFELGRVDADLSSAADRALAEDRRRIRLHSADLLRHGPLWVDEPLSIDAFDTAAALSERRVCAGPFGLDRWSQWYESLTQGDPLFLFRLGGALSKLVRELPPADRPGETAVYRAGLTAADVRTQGRLLFSPSIALEPPPQAITKAILPAKRWVNTGFSLPETQFASLPSHTPLPRGSTVYFWLDIGELDAGTIETEPAQIPREQVPDGALLTAVLFGFDDGLEIRGSIGSVRLTDEGSAVERQPGAVDLPDSLREKRLFFELLTPRRGDSTQLRCNLYYRQVLVQSRLITARLGEAHERFDGALASTMDYALNRSLNPAALAGIAPHQLSVMLNGGDGSHQVRFFGNEAEPFSADLSLGENALSDLLEQGRKALRRAAWGTPSEWSGEGYRYGGAPSWAQLSGDLIAFAITGYRIYDTLMSRLPKASADQLAAAMRAPGRVQFTARSSPSELIPAAIVYDGRLDAQVPLTICESFRKAYDARSQLELEPCFQGRCPNLGVDDIVCPGNFWGFRHDIGIPVSLPEAGTNDAPTTIGAAAPASISVCVSTDANFVRRPGHEKKLQALFPGAGYRFADSRKDVKELLKREPGDIIYFYCHGGLSDTVPYILVGNGPGITRENIRGFEWNWSKNRPLVFVNGCHTTALDPSHAFDFVTGFVQTAGAAAVIGTEITIFEPLACDFAESFLSHFAHEREELGRAVRLTRLGLLGRGNPLGLVYLPFGLSSAKVV